MSKYSNHSLVRLCTVFIIVFFMLSVVHIQAQDTPTDVPTDVPTAVPTDVPTEVPTVVPTDVPTEVPTDVPTDIPTDVPTEAATEQVTAAPTTETPVAVTPETSPVPSETVVPTLAPEPPMTVLVNESFDNGDTSPWDAPAGWSLVTSENGLAWQVVNSNIPLNLLKGGFLNVAVQARFLLQGGSAQLIVRQSAAGNYSALIDANGLVVLYRAGVPLKVAQIAPVAVGAWRTLRLSAVDGVLRVAVDGLEVIALADAEQLPPGTVAIAANFAIPTDGSAAPQNILLADDFALLVKTDEAVLYPSPTVIPTEQATEVTAAPTTETPVAATQEASPVATETAVPTLAAEPELTLLLNDPFDGGDTANWATVAGWTLVPSENGLAWQVINTNDPLNLIKGSFLNAAVQARFLLQGGSAQLVVRQSAIGNYTAAMDTSGVVGLYRAGVLLQQTQVAPVAPDAWRTLRLSAVGGVLRVAVDGVEVIALADPEQLPPGSVAIAGNFLIPSDGSAAPQNTFLADDFSLWVTADEVPDTTAVVTETPAAPTAAATLETPTAEPTYIGKRTGPVEAPSAALIASLGPLANDAFASSALIPAANPLVAYTASDNTTGATLEGGEPTQPSCTGNHDIGRSVWFVFTPAVTATYTLSTAGSQFDTVMVVYTGGAVNSLAPVACSDDASISTFTSQIKSVTLNAGTVYHIQISGFEADYGAYTFNIMQDNVPKPLVAPLLASPPDNFYTNNGTKPLPPLTWSAVAANTHHYEIQIDDAATFALPLRQTNISILAPMTSYTVTPNLPGTAGTVYFWRVRALNSNSVAGPWSVTHKFIVDTNPPAAPVLSLPADKVILSTVQPVFKWAAAATAGSYRLDVDEDTDNDGVCDFATPVTGFNDLTVNALTYTAPAPGLPQGSYCWRVRSVDAANNPTLNANTVTRRFTIFIGTAPLNAALSTTGLPAFTWAAVTSATGYQVQVSTNTSFSALVVDQPVAPPATTFTPLAALPSNTYYWRVQVSGVTPVSTVYRTLFVGASMPLAPTLIGPPTTPPQATQIVSLSWNPVAPVDNIAPFDYEIQIANNAAFSVAPQTFTSLTSPALTPTLSNGKTYFWHVRARYGTAATPIVGPWSASRTFGVDILPPAAPVLSLPADKVILTTVQPVFKWVAAATSVGYRLDVDEDTDNDGVCDFSTPIINNQTVNALTYTAPAPGLPQGSYCWRVRSVDASGNITATVGIPVRRFTIFIGTAPLNAALSTTGLPAFTWAAVASATGYQLQVSSNTSFSALVLDQPVALPATTFTPSPALPTGTYYWRVLSTGETPVSSVYRTLFVGASMPLAPTLIGPPTTPPQATQIVSLSWNPVAPVDNIAPFGYEIQIANNAAFSVAPQTIFSATSPAVTPTLLNGKTYFWHVRARYGTAATPIVGPWSASRTFGVDLTPPAAPVLSLPADKVILTTVQPVFKWAAAATSVGYRLDIDEDTDNNGVCDFATPVNGFDTLPVTGLTYTVPVPGLAQGSYCWRVRSVDASGNITATTGIPVRRFTIFIGTAPLNAVLSTTGLPTFAWTAVSGNTNGYDLEIASDSGFSTIVQTPHIGPAPVPSNFTLITPLASGTYYWRVQVSGVTPVSTVYRTLFVGASMPLAPTLIGPTAGAAQKTQIVSLSWNPVAPVGNIAPFDYEIQIANNAAFSVAPQTFTSLTSPALTPTLLNGKTYFWHVRARYGTAATPIVGPWSASRSFPIDIILPAVPTLLQPANNASTTANLPKFTWGAVTGAVKYNFKYGTSNPPSITVPVNPVPAPSFIPPGPLLNKTYYWQVEAVDAAGNVSVSAIRSVKITSLPKAAPLLNRFTGSPIVLTWSPISWVAGTGHYEVAVANNSAFKNPTTLTAPNNAAPSLDVSPLDAGTWYWHVRACSDVSASTCSPTWSTMGTFTVDN